MPRLLVDGKHRTKSISIRIAADQIETLQQHANLRGVPLSTYLSKMVIAGVMAESISDIETRMRSLIASIPQATGIESDAQKDAIALSTFTSEELLKTIVSEQNIQAMYSAQDAAKAKLNKLKGA